MPELPEVETVRRGIAPVLEGQTLTRVERLSPKLRWAIPETLSQDLTGARVERLRRRGKYILMDVDRGLTMILHLGMSGKVLVLEDASTWERAKHDHILFVTETGGGIVFNDARRFGSCDLVPTDQAVQHKLLASMGPEPLSNGFNQPAFEDAIAGKRSPIKTVLLDQSVVAGIGNIYACEALWRARISPKREARTVPGVRAERLVPAVRAVLEAAIASGGSTLRDYVRSDGQLGYFQHQFDVYGREGEPCKREGCSGTIKRLVQSGRSTFYCPICQR